MPKVVSFPKGTVLDNGSHPDAIKLLKTLLKEAEKGDLQGIAIAAVYEDGSLYSDWSISTEDRLWYELLTAVMRLKSSLEEAECDT